MEHHHTTTASRALTLARDNRRLQACVDAVREAMAKPSDQHVPLVSAALAVLDAQLRGGR